MNKRQIWRLFSLVTALILVFTAFTATITHADTHPDAYIDTYNIEYQIINVKLEGELVVFDGQQPILLDGRVLVPVRGLFEMLGFTANWNPEAELAVLTRQGYTVLFAVGSDIFTINGINYALDVPAQLVNGSMMMPIRFPLEQLGLYVGWEPGTLTALVSSTPIPEPEPPTVRRPMVALTFDDGPAAHTEHIVNLLEYHNARATFFVIGRRINSRRDIVIRAHELGNEIANHLFHHQIMTVMTEAEILQDVRAGSAAISAVIGYSPPIIRPPGGAINDRVNSIVGSAGYALIMWSYDTHDWRDRNATTVYRRIMDNVQDGDIILLHDTHRTTAVAMERVIPGLIERGFQLVTVSELLTYAHGEGSPEPGRVYFHGR